MSVKAQALASIRKLPANAGWEQIEERIRYLAAIDRGLKDIAEGRVISHDTVKQQLRRWVRK